MGLSVAEYGDLVWASMFGKVSELSEDFFHADGGPFYYLWNIPVNILPWALFAVIGAGMVLRSLWKPGSKAVRQPYPHR